MPKASDIRPLRVYLGINESGGYSPQGKFAVLTTMPYLSEYNIGDLVTFGSRRAGQPVADKVLDRKWPHKAFVRYRNAGTFQALKKAVGERGVCVCVIEPRSVIGLAIVAYNRINLPEMLAQIEPRALLELQPLKTVDSDPVSVKPAAEGIRRGPDTIATRRRRAS